MRLRQLVLGTAAAATFAMAAQAQDYEAPRTQWGQPDLQGVWNFSSNIPLERPAFFADKAFLTDEDLAAMAAQPQA
ncbi:MAG: hypothetical protein AB8B95_03450, partial [Pseudohongiellaceae bacterium]